MKSWGLGITAPVHLLARPLAASLNDVFVKTSWRQKQLTLDCEIQAAKTTSGLKLVATIVDASGKPALKLAGQPFNAQPGVQQQSVSSAWANPTPWELDAGYLYTARVQLESDGQVVQNFPEIQFGFREIWSQGREIFLNGHPIRFRLASLMQGGESNVNSIGFFRQIGYNVFLFQNNPTAWWRDWAETPYWSEAVLDNLDKTGSGLLMPAPSVTYNIRGALLSDPNLVRDFSREMDLYLRRYRNRPSVLAWTIGMNSYNPRSAISPQGFGRRENSGSAQVKSINLATSIAKELDPTRFTYSHADGGTGDIASGNVYLNFAPLQEREEWPSLWAQTGDMPAMAAEFGQPYTANFWKGKRFFLTEYLSMYFGDQAYLTEGLPGLRRTIDYGLANQSGHGAMISVDLKQYPLYWEFQKLFVRNTNRSWRTLGVNAGWSYWVYDMGYGEPPGVDTGRKNFVSTRYRDLKTPITGKPTWASPNFEIHQQANQPLLAYIAGTPATDKTHAYYSGERVQKQLAFVWDGPGPQTAAVNWKLQNSGATVTSGSSNITLKPGDIRQLPVSFQAPQVAARKVFQLEMECADSSGQSLRDSFQLEIFPPAGPLQPGSLPARIALWDPSGKSTPWLRQLGIQTATWQPGSSLENTDLLIVGREALGPGRKPPYSPQDLARGLKVLVLEQQPETWEGLGFQLTDTMPRYVFIRDQSSPVLAGLAPADFINWRGSPDLLPEGINRAHDTLHAPKWTNRHAVASVALQIPEIVGFTPLLSCEFDSNYSPLLQMRYGQGQVTFCSLDLTGRVGSDPAATLLARNLLQSFKAKLPATREVLSVGNSAAVLPDLGVAPTMRSFTTSSPALLLCGSGLNEEQSRQLSAASSPGTVIFHLPTSQAELAKYGLLAKQENLQRATPPQGQLFRAISPGLWRWRDEISTPVFSASGQPTDSQVLADGLVLTRSNGKAQEIYLQIGPGSLENHFPDDPEKQLSLQTSRQRLRQLTSQLLTNCGASVSPEVAQRLCRLKLGSAFETLRTWQVLGPFPVDKEDGEAMLATAQPGEAEAMAGDTNPNTTYKLSNGTVLDWRRTVSANETGFIDLASQLKGPNLAVAYLTREIESKADRVATLQLGADYRVQVWVNGKLTFRTTNGRARPNAYQVQIPLKRGSNVLTLKVASGSRGFGVWTALSTEDSDLELQSSPILDVPFYGKSQPNFDPYEFHYW